MKTVEIVGYHRTDFSKSANKQLRNDALTPCILYGGEQPISFSVPMILFRDIVYTPNVCFVDLNLEGVYYKCILQDAQFHPVSEMLMHADFLMLQDNKKIRMAVPIRFIGTAVGIQQGGKLISKLRKVTVEALPKDMPEFIDVNVTDLGLGKSIRINALTTENYKILDNPLITIASISVPRAAKSGK